MVFASDVDEKACQTLEKVVRDNDLSGAISVFQKDFFDLVPSRVNGLKKTKGEGLIVLNPPYGRRLKTRKESEKVFVEICRKLKKDFKGWKVALIAPRKKLVRKIPFIVTAHDFFHGGLKVTLLTGRVRDTKRRQAGKA